MILALADSPHSPSSQCRSPASTDAYHTLRAPSASLSRPLVFLHRRTAFLNSGGKYYYSLRIEVNLYRLYRKEDGAEEAALLTPKPEVGGKRITPLLAVTTERVVPCPWSWHFPSPPFLRALQSPAVYFTKTTELSLSNKCGAIVGYVFESLHV